MRFAARLCQRSEDAPRDGLDALVLQQNARFERRGRKKRVTYHLSRSAATELLSKAAYTRTRHIDAVRYPELVRAYVKQHGSIDCEYRELLGLGNSKSTVVKASNLLGSLDFLEPAGTSRKKRRYYLKAINTK